MRTAADPGAALAQAVFDAMFSDMDQNLREIGVSDLSVGKRMRAMWEAFHGRAKVYASAIEAADRAALEAALARNVWRGAAPVGAAASLTRVVLAQTVHLAEQPLAALVSGRRISCQRRRHAMNAGTVTGPLPSSASDPRDWM